MTEIAGCRIGCVGGMVLDRRVRPLGRLRRGTSNPVAASDANGLPRCPSQRRSST